MPIGRYIFLVLCFHSFLSVCIWVYVYSIMKALHMFVEQESVMLADNLGLDTFS